MLELTWSEPAQKEVAAKVLVCSTRLCLSEDPGLPEEAVQLLLEAADSSGAYASPPTEDSAALSKAASPGSRSRTRWHVRREHGPRLLL
jgi:hypothetical protein